MLETFSMNGQKKETLLKLLAFHWSWDFLRCICSSCWTEPRNLSAERLLGASRYRVWLGREPGSAAPSRDLLLLFVCSRKSRHRSISYYWSPKSKCENTQIDPSNLWPHPLLHSSTVIGHGRGVGVSSETPARHLKTLASLCRVRVVSMSTP